MEVCRYSSYVKLAQYLFVGLLTHVLTTNGQICYSMEVHRDRVKLRKIDCAKKVQSSVVLPTNVFTLSEVLAKAGNLLESHQVDASFPQFRKKLSLGPCFVSTQPSESSHSETTTLSTTEIQGADPLTEAIGGLISESSHFETTTFIPTEKQTVDPLTDESCPSWTPYDGSLYCYIEKEVGYDEAAVSCRRYSRHAHLAVIENMDENNFIYNLTKDVPPSSMESYFAGVTRITGHGGVVSWVSDNGQNATFFNWDSVIILPAIEPCIVAYIPNGGTWFDKPCYWKYYFVCEYRIY